MTTVPPVPSPRPAEEIRSEVPKLDGRQLADAIDMGDESWFWPVDGEVAQVIDVLRDLQQTRGEVERLSAELADARAEVERLTTSRDRFVNRLRKIRAELPGVPLTGLATAVAELRTEVEREKLRRINVSNTLWAHIAELHEDHQADERALEAVREWAFTVHGGTKSPADVWPGLRAALSAASPTTNDDEPGTKPAALLLREIAERDPEAHGQALGRGYGIDRDPAHYPPTTSDEPARCKGTLGERPSWMSPGQFSPCRCELLEGHDGECHCEHTRPGPAASGTPETTR